jgi:hypothetical protein
VHDVIQTSANKTKADAMATGEAKRVLDAPLAQTELVNHNAALDQMDAKISEILGSPGIETASGTILGRLPTLRPATANTEADIASLAAKTGFAVLQEMRQASKTGGALGSISDAEEKLLQNALEPFADKLQSPEHMKASLNNLRNYIKGARQRASDAYNRMYTAPVNEPKPAPTITPAIPAKNRLQAFPH